MYERYTAFFHLRAMAGQGTLAGVLLFNEYILRKHLGGAPTHILVLLVTPALLQAGAVLWNPATSGGPLARRPFRTLGMGLHLLLLLPLLAGGAWSPHAFVALLVTVLIGQALLIPIQNSIVARNYGEAGRARRFGRAAAVQSLFILVTSLPLGMALDQRPGAWPIAYALAGLAAIYAYWQWGRLRRRRAAAPPPDLQQHASAWRALRKDRTFLAFEGCFMVYGLGFLALQPVLPLFLVDELGVTYTDVSLARGAIFWIVMILASPLVGQLGDRLGLLRLGALGFLCLALFPLTLRLLPNHVGLFTGYALYGLAMSAVNLTWNLGPITMARGRDPMPYFNAHVAAVGVRAPIGMAVAMLVHQAFGSQAVFVGVAVLEVLAAALMFWLAVSTGRRWRPPPVEVDALVPRQPR